MTTLYFQIEEGLVTARLQSDVPVNAWDGRVIFPGGVRRIILDGDATYVWQTSPQITEEGIVFLGGSTRAISGDAALFRFEPRDGGTAWFASDTKVYRADGKGTPATTTLTSLDITAAAPAALQDSEPPERFRPQIYRQPDLFEGHSVLIFEAQDPGSGIAYYEVREHLRSGTGGWHRAESPYRLAEDIFRIEVKAVDNFGNARVESVRLVPYAPTTGIALAAAVAVAVLWGMISVKRPWRR